MTMKTLHSIISRTIVLPLLLSLSLACEYASASEYFWAEADTLQASIVYPKGALMRFMKSAAETFEESMPNTCLYNITFTKTVSAGGKYREFFGYKGIQGVLDWHIKTKSSINQPHLTYFWFPLSLMRSKSWEAGVDEVLEQQSLNSNVQGNYETRTNINYDNTGAPGILMTTMRGIEVQSPLNSMHVKDFDYFVEQLYDDGSIKRVAFQTKKNAFPRKTRLYGKGYMTFSPEGRICDVAMFDYLDYWSKYPHAKISSVSKTATSHSCKISYTFKDGHYCLKSIDVESDWNPSKRGGSYDLIVNPRRHPYKERLKEKLHLQLSDMTVVPKSTFSNLPVFGLQTAYAPYVKEVWDKDLPKWLDFTIIVSDLNINGESFQEQCERPVIYDENNLLRNRNTQMPLTEEEREDNARKLTQAYDFLQKLIESKK